MLSSGATKILLAKQPVLRSEFQTPLASRPGVTPSASMMSARV
jgi:hypothetical protein